MKGLMKIDVKNVVSITTDGAPAMIRKEKGAAQWLKDQSADIPLYNTPLRAVC